MLYYLMPNKTVQTKSLQQWIIAQLFGNVHKCSINYSTMQFYSTLNTKMALHHCNLNSDSHMFILKDII